ncbi:hypothetical protein Cflav_PD6383 [Pedosphaera parvula Ellin514]|uniref:Uncharacterized protein n=1 Tax=Pedosphaera parvula (strain Ellin514) TaxID=320771 RepID=B9XDG2_PEDPL|nr:hypothetical protein Cflav_PD6383 [Pedosphaera parvula Ellin514]
MQVLAPAINYRVGNALRRFRDLPRAPIQFIVLTA